LQRTALLIFALSQVSVLGQSTNNRRPLDSGWNNLKSVTRDRGYVVVLQDHTCTGGKIASVTDQGVVLGSDLNQITHLLKLEDVLRVGEGWVAGNAIYSARSSWSDVKETMPRWREYMTIVTNEGRKLQWKQPMVSEDSITFEGHSLPKSDVRYVSYVRYKPLTPTQELFAHENVELLAPRLWFHDLFLGKMSVLLYDASLIEDDSPLVCPH
jgi:hypothetical protein